MSYIPSIASKKLYLGSWCYKEWFTWHTSFVFLLSFCS